MKKANELSILCDIPIILLMFSPTGKPSLCKGKRRSAFSCHALILSTIWRIVMVKILLVYHSLIVGSSLVIT
ncbi:unnamed protein product [Linum tenue]|uniref:MADS-box domain-containing protein n=1 Tax=Linum tenue TaxID=586396 RepID=A0AAV0IWW3_9ROSI|nr:unnamed protein product [Linum tenue]